MKEENVKTPVINRVSVTILFIIIFSVYWSTLPESLTLEDSGLFLMSSYFFGIAHPPGYPLYTLLSGLFGQLPFDPFPLKIHAFSALCASLTCIIVYLLGRTLSLSRITASGISLLLAFSLTYWSQAIIAEVYSLGLLLILTLFLLAIKLTIIEQTDDSLLNKRLLMLMAGVSGLALTVHVPFFLLSVPALLIILWPVRNIIWKNLPLLLLIFIVCLSPYAWMVWRSTTDVVINFSGAIKTTSDFLFIFSRQGYVGVDISTTAGLADKIAYFKYLNEQLNAQFTLAGTLLALLGFVMQRKHWNTRIAFSISILFFCHSFLFLFVLFFDYDLLSRAVFSVYPLIAYVVMALWIGVGLVEIAKFIINTIKLPQAKSFILGLMITGLTGFVVFNNYPLNNRSDYQWAKQYTDSVLSGLPKNADLFVSGDIHTFTLGYVHHVEQLRPDISIYSFQGGVFNNRLFDPRKSTENEKLKIIEEYVKQSTKPICTTEAITAEHSQSDYGLFSCFNDESSEKYSLSLTKDVRDYIGNIWKVSLTDAWSIYHRQQLTKKIATSLGMYYANQKRRHDFMAVLPEQMLSNFFFQLGYLEGLSRYVNDYQSLNEMIRIIKEVKQIPDLIKKHELASYYNIRGDVSVMAKNLENASLEYQRSVETWPHRTNPSISKLLGIYKKQGQQQEYSNLKNRFL